jgi:hypothetical protein
LADEAVKRQIVERISPASVGRFLNQADLKPHQVEHWLNAPERDSEEFHEQVKTICELYAQAPQLHAQGVHVISTDEKTGIAGARAARRPPNRCCRASRARPARSSARKTNTFVVDQLNTHQSESLVCWVANQLQHTGELGRKGESGSLKSMSTRAEFLSRPEHRLRFVYTPKHCSWLNQVEMWFSILVRRLLERASFTSTEELRQRILDFIEYFNRTLAKPFKWTYRGRPLTV